MFILLRHFNRSQQNKRINDQKKEKPMLMACSILLYRKEIVAGNEKSIGNQLDNINFFYHILMRLDIDQTIWPFKRVQQCASFQSNYTQLIPAAIHARKANTKYRSFHLHIDIFLFLNRQNSILSIGECFSVGLSSVDGLWWYL